MPNTIISNDYFARWTYAAFVEAEKRKTGKVCSVEFCHGKRYCKGLCRKHYERLRANGDPLLKKRKNTDETYILLESPPGWKHCYLCGQRKIENSVRWYGNKCWTCELDRSREYKSQNREQERERWRGYTKRFPEKIREKERKRRARKANAPLISPYTPQQVIEKTGEFCQYCSHRIARDGDPIRGLYEMDHRVALDAGGEDTLENMQGVCKSCNSSKHIKGHWAFLLWRAETQPDVDRIIWPRNLEFSAT